MEARILLAADFANVDTAGKLNILGAFNRIYVPEFPAKHGLMYIVLRLAAELGEFNIERGLRVTLFDVDGRETWTTGNIPFTVPDPSEGRVGEFHAILQIQNAEFEKPGRYEYRVLINDDLKGSIPIDVELRGQHLKE